HRADQIEPKVTELRRPFPRVAPNESDANSETRCAGEKVLSREQQLAEVAHGRLTGIRLPCGGSRKTNCRVGSQILCHRCSYCFRKKPRERGLPTKREIEQDDVNQAKYAEREGVTLPIHLALRIDSEAPMDQSLYWKKHRIQPGMPS